MCLPLLVYVGTPCAGSITGMFMSVFLRLGVQAYVNLFGARNFFYDVVVVNFV